MELLDSFIFITLIKAAVVLAVLLTTLAYLQWVERKVIAHVQVRPGPYRVGPHGLLQPVADIVKLLTKEDLLPPYVNKPLYLLAPFLAMTMSLLSISVIPFGPTIPVGPVKTWMQLTDLNIGVLFILAVSSMGVYGIALAGWASNNKYALLGVLRSSAQMISYELPMSLAIAAPLLISNTLSLRKLVESQSGSILNWNILHGPFPQIVSFILFIIAAFAETNRVPFDLPEAENELVAGFHTEYGSMKFAAFFMAEYCNMVTISCVATLLFLGGWHPPFPAQYGSSFLPSLVMAGAGVLCFLHAMSPARPLDRFTLPVVGVAFFALAGVFLIPAVALPLMPIIWFSAKALVILFVYIWVRGTLPRFRYDQLMRFAWTFMFPVAVVNLFLTGLVVALMA